MDTMDARLEVALRKSETAIGDDGFTEVVMNGLPRKSHGGVKARRWTLAGAAAAGSVLTSVLGAPLESVFSTLVLGSGYSMAILAALLFIGILAVPVAWVLYSK